MFVKICGLRDAQHVDAAVAAGADAVGFVFHPKSVRNISPSAAMQASSDVPANVKRVAVMMHPSTEAWRAVLEEFRPDVLQTDVADFPLLDVPDSVERWPVHREGSPAKIETTTFVFEGANSGQGQTVDWAAAAPLARDGNMILAGGLRIDNVAVAIDTVQPFGVDISSGVESAPGEKNTRLIENFIKTAKAAEAG